MSSNALSYLKAYAITNNLNIRDIPVSGVINILNIYNTPYTLIECDEGVEVCLVETPNLIIGNIIKSDKECCVCIEDFNTKNKIVKLECKHIFHYDCLFETIKFKNSCPMCRQHIQIFLR
jgi:hypothetical protein